MDVRLEHGLLVLFAALPEWVAAETEARVVDEDVDRIEFADRELDEASATLGVTSSSCFNSV
jgi:hypothetical protein